MEPSTSTKENDHAPLPGSRFMRACQHQVVDATPIWLMRQAGRYMQEYRSLRAQHSLLEMIKQPELAAEVTMQPIKAFDLDAAIIFADILPPLEGMGLQLEFMKGEGPVIHNPIRTRADVEALRVPDPQQSLSFTLDAIKLVRKELDGRGIPLIGFSGAPFTLAAYAIEGGGSKSYLQAKALMMSDPATWHLLMQKLSELVGHYLLAQVHAGAQVLQFFDSWVGNVSPADYREFVLPHSRHAIAIASQGGVPIIHFGTSTSGMLDLIKQAGGDIIGIDWHIDLDTAWHQLGYETTIQGNLDPAILLGPWSQVQKRTQEILDGAADRPGYIFNLGHGIYQTTPVDNVRRLVDFVHEYSARQHAAKR